MKKSRSRRLPEVLTAEEQALLLGEVEKSATSPGGLRDLALVSLMLAAGLRASEVLALTTEDIEWGRGRLTVRQGKGGKDRTLWLADEIKNLLVRWLAAREPERRKSSNREKSSNPVIFTTLNGQRPMGARWLRYRIAILAQRAGITKRVHPHTLRHTFATSFLRQEKNLFLVSKALGHEDLSTTQIYLHLEDHELEAAMKRMGNGG